jgi:hypothetical protein
MTSRKSNEQFIKECIEIHGDKYDYSKVNYTGKENKIDIYCKLCKEYFKMRANVHLRGANCQICAKIIQGKKRRLTNIIFIEKCKKKDINNMFDYSLVEYKTMEEKIILKCNICNYIFERSPNKHLTTLNGCKNCQINNMKSNTEEFIEKAIKIHGDKYDYSKVDYNTASDKVIIICKEHGEFEQTPNNHLRGANCQKCSGCYQSNTEEFIEKAIKIHGDKYDYSKVDYNTTSDKVIIICKIHDDFLQTPNGHLNGTGCPKCNGGVKSNTEEFIEKAIKIHGDKYDYSKVNYNNCHTNIIIICKKHGEFEQSPNNHLRGANCQICVGNYKSYTEEFIEKARKLHGDKYDYSKVDYINNHTKVIIICKEHNEFEQTPQSHLSGSGCTQCGIISMKEKQSLNNKQFIERAIEIHGDKYDYSKVDYINAKEKVIIICKKHNNKFKQDPDSHLHGTGCPICGTDAVKEKRSFNTEEFIEKAIKMHGHKYDYSKVNYNNCHTNIIIICKEHGEFEQSPNNHLRGAGCLKCSNNCSKVQIECLTYLEEILNIKIQHAKNEGEFKIPKTRYKVDGYCSKTNTIFEFHGDYWHGNPKIFDKDDINKRAKTTFGELYEKTKNKAEFIKKSGYNLIEIWENDWYNYQSIIVYTIKHIYKLLVS